MKLWKKLLCILSLIAVIISFTETKLHANEYHVKSNAKEYTNVYRYKRNSNRQIALTFDDGPHPVYTARILDILKKYNIKATFFMIGENVINYTDIALRVKEDGHEIGNHTSKHLSARKSSQKELEKDMLECSEIINNMLDYKTSLMRPPEGFLVDSVINACNRLGCSIILWNVDTRDWAHTSSDNILKNVMQNTDSGDIILMHDYISHGSPTPEALELIIPRLLDSGYVFVTVSELIRADG